MPKAARFGDPHTCPKVEPGPTPHVGGPIASPCSPDVLFEDAGAARVSAARTGDFAKCEAGTPDFIRIGSPNVFINDMNAARLGDGTVHGGVITGGAAEVEIGMDGDGVALLPRERSEVGSRTGRKTDETRDASQDSGSTGKPTDPADHPTRTSLTLIAQTVTGGLAGISEGRGGTEFELQFTNQSPRRGSFDGTSFAIELSADEAASLSEVAVWGVPYGHFTVALPSERVYHGAITASPTLISATELEFPFQVARGVAVYMTEECNKNANGPFVRWIRRFTYGRDAFDLVGNVRDASAEIYELAQRFRFMSDEMWAAVRKFDESLIALNDRFTALSNWAVIVRPRHGDWDHKPKISPVWGERNRLGVSKPPPFRPADGDDTVYFDKWSNIHFGFVGAACGFSLRELLGGADLAQRLDNVLGVGRSILARAKRGELVAMIDELSNLPSRVVAALEAGDPPEDSASIECGFHAYQSDGSMTVDSYVDMVLMKSRR